MIVYLHGLNSAGSSNKATWLRQQLAPVPVLAPTYPAHRAEAAVAALRAYLARARREAPDDQKLLLVGSSLGGFYAPYLAPEFHAGIVLINPSVDADETLTALIGPQRNEATGEEYVLTREQVRALAPFRLARCQSQTPTLVLLDQGDEVIDYRVAEAFYHGCGQTLVYPGGSHRFDHLPEAMPVIRRLYDAL